MAPVIWPIHESNWFLVPFGVYVFGGLYRCVYDMYTQYRAIQKRVERARKSAGLPAVVWDSALFGPSQALAEGIAAERTLLAPVRAAADLVIDTSALSVPALREIVERSFGAESAPTTSVTVESFGFKYGLPMDADMVMDVRFLPNPHWVDELRPHSGQHPAVRDYVLGQPGAQRFLSTYHELLGLVVDGYRREGKRYMTVAIGCTGGKHRSVAMAEALTGLLSADPNLAVRALHRDLGRE